MNAFRQLLRLPPFDRKASLQPVEGEETFEVALPQPAIQVVIERRPKCSVFHLDCRRFSDSRYSPWSLADRLYTLLGVTSDKRADNEGRVRVRGYTLSISRDLILSNREVEEAVIAEIAAHFCLSTDDIDVKVQAEMAARG